MNEIVQQLEKADRKRGWNLTYHTRATVPVGQSNRTLEEKGDFVIKVDCPSEEVYIDVLRFLVANQWIHKVKPTFQVEATTEALPIIRRVWRETDHDKIPGDLLAEVYGFLKEYDSCVPALSQADAERMEQ